jgi:hypothetical protein
MNHQHRMLDLDAEVFGDNLAAVLNVAGVPARRTVVDLGAGTGAGSGLLREQLSLGICPGPAGTAPTFSR